MKRFNSTKPKYNKLLYLCAFITNSLYKWRMDFMEFIGDRIEVDTQRGWDGDH